ncbi:MAG: hypothetical protein AAF423_01665 [Pseudomonadota bacterium]
MANEAKKSADESALDAVEKALSIDFSEDQVDGLTDEDMETLENSLSEETKDGSSDADSTEASDIDTPGQESSEQIDDFGDLPDQPPAPANDEHSRELNNLLYALQQKPRSSIFTWTSLASLLWIGLCGYYGYVNILPDLPKPVTIATITGSTEVITLAVVLIALLLPLWGFAIMLKRAHEMRHAAGSMIQVSLQLLQPENIAKDSVATVGTAIRREMTAIGDGVERAIARAGELEFMVQKEVMSLERSYGDSEIRLRRLLDDIGVEREEVVTHAERLRNSIAESQTGLTNEIEIASTRIDDTFKAAANQLSETLDGQGITITSRLKGTSDELIEVLSQTNDRISTNLSTGTEQLNASVTDRIREMSETIATSGQAVATLIDSRTASFDQITSDVSQKLETGRKAFEIAFGERSDDLRNIISTTGQSVTTLLRSSSEELTEQNNNMLSDLEDKRKQLESTLDYQAQQFGQLSNLATDNFSAAIETGSTQFEENAVRVAQQLADNLSIRVSDFDSRINESAEVLENTLKENLNRVDSTLSTSGSNLVSALGMQTEALGKLLQERTSEVGETISARLTGFGQNLTGQVDTAINRLKEQSDALQENTKTAETIIVKRTQSVEDTIRSSTIQFAEGLKENIKNTAEKSAELNQALEITADKLSSVLGDSANTITATLQDADKNITTSLDEHTSKMQEALSERANSLSSRLNQGIHRLTNAISVTGNEAAEDLEKHVTTLEERLSENSKSIEKQFAAGSYVLQQHLDQGRDNLVETLSKSVEDAGTAIDGKAEKLSELLTERADMIHNSLGKSLVDTQRKLETKTEEMNSILASRTSELSEIIERDAKPIVASIEATGEAINNRLVSMSKQVADEATILFENLTGSNEKLEGLINSATSNLSLLQTSLDEQSSRFADSVKSSQTDLEESNSIAKDIEEKLQSTSTNLLQNMSSIANRLEAQGSVLQDATRLIDAAHTGLTDTLESKQVTLQELSSGLVLRSDEINNSVSSFAEMVASMMEDVHVRSKGVGGEIAAEVSDAINQATARFGDSVEAMRAAAATMRTELEQTREQMRRGVLELPDETAQNAAAMRRVVTDQIAALKDLSSIVERSGKIFDTQHATALRSDQDTGRLQAASGTARIQQPAPAPARTQRIPAGQRQQSSVVNFPPDTNPSPAPAFPSGNQQQVKAPSRPAPQRQQASRQDGGWVSDLLRRASDEEPRQRPAPVPQPDPRSPDQFVESLNSLSMDIANAIDHEASIDLWERYQRGETNVFTRRLYTIQGQQTFDEISNKYSRDREFRGAVDRYIDDFERLLGDVSKNDQSGTMAQSYLTSDTGKVYTMLAHAAGRFSNI